MTDTIDLGAKALTQSDVDAFDPQVFSDMIVRNARQANFMRELAVEVSDALVGGNGSALEYREFGGFSANDKTEAGSGTPQNNTQSTVKVDTTIKKQVVVQITQEALDDSNVAELEEIANEIGVAHADAFAQEMYDLVGNYSALVTNGSASDHKVSTSDAIDFGDVKDAAFANLGTDERTGDALIVHPVVYATMLDDTKLVKANEVGSDQFVREGQQREEMKMHVAGVDVWVSMVANKPDGTTDSVVGVMLDTDHAFVAVYKNRPDVREDEQVAERVMELSSFERYGKGVLNEDAICFLSNA